MKSAPRQLQHDERIAWLRLARTPNIGPATFAALLRECGGIHEALEAAPILARRGGKQLKIASAEIAERELDAVNKRHGRIVAVGEPEYPTALAAIDPPPPIITVLGSTDALTNMIEREAIAIVGARNASALGIKFAQTISTDLCSAGFLIASGMARGVDRAAHEAALASGTIAVVAGGADIVYPPENQALYDEILERGAIISEMPLGTRPQARHFPRRNRIISGLSRGVVVVEAAERSGSLITAGYALEQGREVFAVPGSPLDPRAKGSNRLLKEGASLATSAEDVLAALQPMLNGAYLAEDKCEAPPAAPIGGLSGIADGSVRELVEEKLSASPVEIDELVRQIGALAPIVLSILLELELAQRLQRHPGARVSWC
jgi:DNA processing protein